MIKDLSFIPQKPFPDFKWKWASLQCTESLNDPLILLGVLFRMRKLEGKETYSSVAFGNELADLEKELHDSSITVNLAGRKGERNIIRNSGQYWKALGLIDDETRGAIKLTDFGRKVADREISKTQFSSIIVTTLTLPNYHIQSPTECAEWKNHHLLIHPLKLILQILCALYNFNKAQSYLTPEELYSVIIPLSGTGFAEVEDYVTFILAYRKNAIDISRWTNCCPGANGKRIAREFLLFLYFYGFIKEFDTNERNRFKHEFHINESIIDEIKALLDIHDFNVFATQFTDTSKAVNEVAEDIERKKTTVQRTERPGQRKFRKTILKNFNFTCAVTGVQLPEVLEAAHIKPVEYKGNDSDGNGLCLRLDIHRLFDTSNLIIMPNGDIQLTRKAQDAYGKIIPPHIILPDCVNRDYLKWRLNYDGV